MALSTAKAILTALLCTTIPNSSLAQDEYTYDGGDYEVEEGGDLDDYEDDEGFFNIQLDDEVLHTKYLFEQCAKYFTVLLCRWTTHFCWEAISSRSQ